MPTSYCRPSTGRWLQRQTRPLRLGYPNLTLDLEEPKLRQGVCHHGKGGARGSSESNAMTLLPDTWVFGGMMGMWLFCEPLTSSVFLARKQPCMLYPGKVRKHRYLKRPVVVSVVRVARSKEVLVPAQIIKMS